jgi:hypothetical protein
MQVNLLLRNKRYFSELYYIKNVDIEFSEHYAFLE